jgi:hypothetical protein
MRYYVMLFTFVKNEDGEWDQSCVDISEPDEHGVHCSQGVLLNFWNL